jgi:hypothetical protein
MAATFLLRDNMDSLLAVREKIYNHIENYSKCDFHRTATHNDFIIYCISKDTIQDTAEAILAHREKDFAESIYERYLEYYGLLQAIYLQQDAICALHKLFIGERPNLSSKKCWKELRDLRVCTVGHPVGRRKFLSRNAITYNEVAYSWWPEGKKFPKRKTLNLSGLLDGYSDEATSVLQTTLDAINKKCQEDN